MINKPVKISHFVSVVFRRTTGERVRERHYFKATSHSLGDCGHEHKSAKAAEPCRVRLQQKWHEARYGR